MGAEGIGPSWRAWHDGFTDRPGSIPVYAPDNVVRVVGLEPTSPGWKPGILGQLDEARLCCCSVSWSPCRESNPIGRATRAAALREHEGGCFPFWRAAEVSILAKLDLESNPDAGPQPELNATKYFVIARISSDRSVGLIYSSAGMARPGAAPEGVVFVGPAPRSVPPGTAGRGGAGRAGRVNVGCFLLRRSGRGGVAGNKKGRNPFGFQPLASEPCRFYPGGPESSFGSSAGFRDCVAWLEPSAAIMKNPPTKRQPWEVLSQVRIVCL